MLGKRLAEGRMAEVFAWDDAHVIKLWKPGFSPQGAQHEYAMVRAVIDAGIRTPAALEATEVNGRVGIVYERVLGPTMAEFAMQDLSRGNQLAQQMAVLHLAIHHCTAPELPSQVDRVRDRIDRIDVLDASLKANLIARLAHLPDADIVCHGDFHPQNIIMAAQGPVVIDWIDASRGHAAIDVARSMLLLQMIDYADVPNEVKLGIAQFRNAYLNHYLQLSGLTREAITKWLPLLAAARINENIPEETEVLIEMAQSER